MGKQRAAYWLTLLLLLTLVFWFSSLYLLAAALLWLLLPVVLWLCLKAECGRIRLELSVKSACPAGGASEAALTVKRKGLLLTAGQLQVQLQVRNFLLDRETTEQLTIPLSGRKSRFPLKVDTSLCGRLELSVKQAACSDVLGLCRVSAALPESRALMIRPRELPLQLSSEHLPRDSYGGDQYRRNRRGNDPGEIFDLREYQPGDDVRAIHWKLSGKLDGLIIREGSDPVCDSTVLLLDLGLRNGEEPVPPLLLSAAAELGMDVSRRLARQGLPHQLLWHTGERLQWAAVHSRDDWISASEKWIGGRLPEQLHSALRLFLADRLERSCRRMIYVTVGRVPDELAGLPADMTILTVTEQGSAVSLTREDRRQMVEFPVHLVCSAACRIIL